MINNCDEHDENKIFQVQFCNHQPIKYKMLHAPKYGKNVIRDDIFDDTCACEMQ